MTPEQLSSATGAGIAPAGKWLPTIEAAMFEFGIIGRMREAAFLAQIGHESGGLYFLVERWGPTPAQLRYEGRRDLGNVKKGDGFLFRGRGLIQTTGRANYAAVGEVLGLDLLASPDLLSLPGNSARSAGWFWRSHGLNQLADTGAFQTITRRINGGLNGYQERLALYRSALKALP